MVDDFDWVSFAGARVTGAVSSTLATILSCLTHLSSLKECLLWGKTNNEGLSGGLL